jgi:pimeloyl-ACP methyl ester carboxylesterase
MFVKVGDVRLFFDVEGAKLVPDGSVMRERPTLLLLHGGPGLDHSWFRPAFSVFAQATQVVYLDQRGHGRSDRSTPERWSLAQWADDVRGFCDAVGIEHPIVLGTSFGGYVAMSYAIRYPDHPAKLILVSTALRGTGDPVRRQRVLEAFERFGGVEAREAMRRAFDDRSPESYSEFRRVCGPLYTSRPLNPDAAKRVIKSADVLPFFERADGEGVTFDYSAELWRVRCPTLIMAGETDPMTPVSEMEEILKALPEGVGRLERFPGCGHGVWRDDPERAFQVITEFLSC